MSYQMGRVMSIERRPRKSRSQSGSRGAVREPLRGSYVRLGFRREELHFELAGAGSVAVQLFVALTPGVFQFALRLSHVLDFLEDSPAGQKRPDDDANDVERAQGEPQACGGRD